MMAPTRWIESQYMIAVINLCSVTPRETKNRRVIKAGERLTVHVEDV